MCIVGEISEVDHVPIGYQLTRHSPLSCDEWPSCLTKVTIRAWFSVIVMIYNHVSWKKSQFSWDAHLSRFWLGAPDLSRFVHLCSCMLTQVTGHWSEGSLVRKVQNGVLEICENVGMAHDVNKNAQGCQDGTRRILEVGTVYYHFQQKMHIYQLYGHVIIMVKSTRLFGFNM